jgi:endoglucanase
MLHSIRNLLVILCVAVAQLNAADKPQFTSTQLVKEMGVGWNLGNTLDAKGKDETAWGNPRATKAMIDAVRAKGFKTLRVPVTWQYHMGKVPDYTIEPAWLKRVQEVVGYGLDNGMYVIIDIHHDEEWLKPTYAETKGAQDRLRKVWRQIANHFKDHGERLIFETLNEPRLIGSKEEWLGGTKEARDCLNQMHRVAVETIRATGGNNRWRHLMISTYAASPLPVAVDALVLPKSKNLIVSVHNYAPYEFCMGRTKQDWGTAEDKKALDATFDMLAKTFVANGIPVVVGEFGSENQKNLEARKRHAAYFAAACLRRGMCPIWWDNGYPHEFGILNRKQQTWCWGEIADAIVSAKP